MQPINESLNDFSFWFPKIENCGIPVPPTFFRKLPMSDDEKTQRLLQAFYMDHPDEDEQVIRNWVQEEIVPELKKDNRLGGMMFVKNGRFSNKFDANRACIIYGPYKLHEAIQNINYEALCCGAGGIDEIVIRHFITYDRQNTPCIYNGLPLRPEFRVFYDFDDRTPIFTANYWDYDYVYPHLYEATDKIIFEHERECIESVFNAHKEQVEKMVAHAMAKVKGLHGQWSVDILLDERGKFWLIDMAVAQRSAYWEQRPNKELYPE